MIEMITDNFFIHILLFSQIPEQYHLRRLIQVNYEKQRLVQIIHPSSKIKEFIILKECIVLTEFCNNILLRLLTSKY